MASLRQSTARELNLVRKGLTIILWSIAEILKNLLDIEIKNLVS